MFGVFHGIPTGRKEIEAHIAALTGTHSSAEHQALFGHLYSSLSILDGKSASLLSFNSIVIAVFAIFMTSELNRTGFILANVGMASVLVSSILLMSVVWIHWSTTDDLQDLREHAVSLLTVRGARTIRYRLAWWFSMMAILTLAGFLVRRFILMF